MIVYPAVDIKGGRCVRLYQGRPDRETVYEDDPLAAAARWAAAGASWLHVVDLDGAFAGFPVNHRLIGNIAAASGVRVQAGGGVRKMETIETLLEAGISRVIVGSRAVRDPDFAQAAVREFGKRVIPSIDSRDGEVLLQGWSERAGAGAETVGIEFRKMGYASTVLTDVSGDGTLAGPDLPGIERFLEATGLKVIAAGGVSSLEDIRNLKCLESKGLEGVITGKAIYDGTLDLRAALAVG